MKHHEKALDFRKAGMTDSAINFSLSQNGLAIVAEHNGGLISQLPPEAGYAPNRSMYEWIEHLGRRKAAGLPTRHSSGRWLNRAEISELNDE